MPDISTIFTGPHILGAIGVVGTLVGIAGGLYGIQQNRKNNSNLKAVLEFYPPASIGIRLVNHGRRKVIVDDICADYADGKTQIIKPSNLGGITLDELEKHYFAMDDLNYLLRQGTATKLYVTDSTGKKYYVKDSKEKLALYYPASKAPLTFDGKAGYKCQKCGSTFMMFVPKPGESVICPNVNCRNIVAVGK